MATQNLKTVREGESELLVPDVAKPEEGEVFYHPDQALARDMSILVYRAYGYEVLDAFAGTGARSVRLVRNGVRVVANDISDRALEMTRQNATHNGVELPTIHNRAEKTIHSRLWEAVDLDPFGTPAPWVHCALLNTKKLLAVCATDTAALTGTYPRVSRRRYGFHSVRTPNYPEVATRALAGFVVREGAKLEVAAEPVFAHVYRHYIRVYFELHKGAGRCDALLKQMGEHRGVHPIWMGQLWKKELVRQMQEDAREAGLALGSKLTLKHLDLITGEVDFPQPYFHLHKLCKELGAPVRPMAEVLEKLDAVRTHFTPLGFRTRKSEDEVSAWLKS